MITTTLLKAADSGSKRTTIEELSLPAGGHLPLSKIPEEQLLYVVSGRGIISLYDPAPDGDVYELRQETAVYMTPAIRYELFNTGQPPLVLVALKVAGGEAPPEEGGGLTWSAVSQRGVTVDKPAPGAGTIVTRVFDERLNPSKEEGMHLRIRDVLLRRPQKMANAEVLTVAPGRATRLHTHYDTSESSYVLSGEGVFVWDDKQIPCKAGDVISYPLGVMRQVINTGRFPLTYVLIASFID
ncbi:MAG: cupin domain-containing protein [Chloroflexota bacterium]